MNTEAKSSHRNGKPRIYQDLLKGRFDINVTRIQRTDNADNDISNKLFDYSTDTIKQLRLTLTFLSFLLIKALLKP
ncbi:MAG: hypothetical protein WBQ25_25430 [Nitrososphaeraceae archaeon]